MEVKLDLFKVAMDFLIQHQAAHLERDQSLLIQRCITHVVDTGSISKNTAEDVTMQAFCEMQSRHQRPYIDLTRTSSFALFIHDPVTAHRHVFSVETLMGLVRAQVIQSLLSPRIDPISRAGPPFDIHGH